MASLENEDIAEQMNALIAEIYSVFAKYKLANDIQGVCTYCCLSGNSLEEIKKNPVSSLSAQAIFDYLDAAANEPESLVVEIKYLLPRILELFNNGQEIRIDTEISFDKFHLSIIELWQPQEIELIQRFARLHFQKLITGCNDVHKSVEAILSMWKSAGLSADFLFAVWEENISYHTAIIGYIECLYKADNFKFSQISICNDFDQNIMNWATSPRVIKLFQDSVYLNIDNLDNLSEEDLFDYDYLLNYA